ncbi:MAG: type II toxin-antitoxin system PemK/MazF family toxin [Alphaproteobacteria bacterium]|nr:type II toxin-antitoxin system PemK/MazF family toxin [Alphaproteobacteria bacterium]MBM3652077.1 type II toxin-antitoxin system PemK/MazF family toxin [Alphaproteobacteria bacterium]
MRRGDVYWINFDPSIGGEIRKRRPAVIVNNNAANEALNRIQVVPPTSNAGRLYPSEAMVTIEGKPSKAMADQLTTASKQRVGGRLGALSAKDLKEVERAIKIQLGLLI